MSGVTVFLSSAFTHLAIGLLLLLIPDRSTGRGVRIWAAGFVVHTVGAALFLLPALWPRVADVPVVSHIMVVLANMFIGATYVLWHVGFMRHFPGMARGMARSGAGGVLWIALVVMTVLQWWYVAVVPSIEVRTALFAVYSVFVLGSSLRLLHRQPGTRTIHVILVLMIAGFAARFVLSMTDALGETALVGELSLLITLFVLYLLQVVMGVAMVISSYEQTVRTTSRSLAQAQKLSSLGTLVAGLAHEISNPVNYILLNGELLRDGWEAAAPIIESAGADEGAGKAAGKSSLREFARFAPSVAEDIISGARRLERLVQELKRYAAPAESPAQLRAAVEDAQQPVCVLGDALAGAVALTEGVVRSATQRSSTRTGAVADTHVAAHRSQVEHIVVNLLQNACHALTEPEQAIEVSAEVDQHAGGVRISVRDEGCGIPQEHIDRLFDPFFTTRRNEGGTGLGLAVVEGVVRELGGAITVDSRVDAGTTITVELPVA